MISTIHVKNPSAEYYVYNKDTIATIAGDEYKERNLKLKETIMSLQC